MTEEELAICGACVEIMDKTCEVVEDPIAIGDGLEVLCAINDIDTLVGDDGVIEELCEAVDEVFAIDDNDMERPGVETDKLGVGIEGFSVGTSTLVILTLKEDVVDTLVRDAEDEDPELHIEIIGNEITLDEVGATIVEDDLLVGAEAAIGIDAEDALVVLDTAGT